MRKNILMMPVGVDDFIEGPQRELDWHKVDDELHRHFDEQLGAIGAFLMGRVTHELMAGIWPDAWLPRNVAHAWSGKPAPGRLATM